MSERYCVFGNPIQHSRSPRIHRLFAEQTAQDICYEASLAPLEDFSGSVQRFFAEGGKGCNVTVPFKEQAYALAEVRSLRAERAGAVNTLQQGRDGRLYGDNTDGVGLVRDLVQNHGVTLQRARILVLGAGGAVRGVLQPLLDAAPAGVYVANRTAEKAQQLQMLFADTRLLGAGLESLSGKVFDVVINGTSAGLSDAMPALPAGVLARGGVAYDMVYGKQTPFMQWAQQQGAGKVIDGLGMLVEQAAEAFFLWRNVRPETAPVLALLRQELEN